MLKKIFLSYLIILYSLFFCLSTKNLFKLNIKNFGKTTRNKLIFNDNKAYKYKLFRLNLKLIFELKNDT